MYFYFLQTSGLSDVVACLQRILERVCLCRILFRFHNKPSLIVCIAQSLEHARIIDTAISRNRKASLQHSLTERKTFRSRLELFPLLILFHPTIWRELFAHKAQERRAARERRKERKQR